MRRELGGHIWSERLRTVGTVTPESTDRWHRKRHYLNVISEYALFTRAPDIERTHPPVHLSVIRGDALFTRAPDNEQTHPPVQMSAISEYALFTRAPDIEQTHPPVQMSVISGRAHCLRVPPTLRELTFPYI